MVPLPVATTTALLTVDVAVVPPPGVLMTRVVTERSVKPIEGGLYLKTEQMVF